MTTPTPDAPDPALGPRELERRLGAFGTRLALRRPALCPEFELFLLGEDVDLEAGCGELLDGEAPPFWAFCWASGQALARILLDEPDRVRGKHVVDLGTGSGIAAIAAARAGARSVIAVDLDPISRRAARLNALHNGVEIQTASTTPDDWDLMLAADVLYETGLREWLLGTARERGPILLADPERTGTPPLDLPLLARVPACTFPDVDSPRRSVALYEIPKRKGAGLR